MSERTSSVWAGMIRGAIAGTAATWLMDMITTGMLDQQTEAATRREEAARPNGRSSVGNLVARIESMTGLTLDESQETAAAQVIHYALGAVPGALYGALRGRAPVVGMARGLAYGALLWAVNDEWMNAALGLSGPVDAYPVQTHARGLVGHLVLGAGTDVGIDLLGG